MRGRRTTRGRCKLRIPLTHPVGCNVLAVKLVTQVCGLAHACGGGPACGFVVRTRNHPSTHPCTPAFNPRAAPQENMMHVYGDPHTWPNLDMTSLIAVGRMVRLPSGVEMAP